MSPRTVKAFSDLQARTLPAEDYPAYVRAETVS